MRASFGLAGTILLLANLGQVVSIESGPNAPFEVAGIKRNADENLALDPEQAALAPAPERLEKNLTMPALRDRSLELTQRQVSHSHLFQALNRNE